MSFIRSYGTARPYQFLKEALLVVLGFMLVCMLTVPTFAQAQVGAGAFCRAFANNEVVQATVSVPTEVKGGEVVRGTIALTNEELDVVTDLSVYAAVFAGQEPDIALAAPVAFVPVASQITIMPGQIIDTDLSWTVPATIENGSYKIVVYASQLDRDGQYALAMRDREGIGQQQIVVTDAAAPGVLTEGIAIGDTEEITALPEYALLADTNPTEATVMLTNNAAVPVKGTVTWNLYEDLSANPAMRINTAMSDIKLAPAGSQQLSFALEYATEVIEGIDVVANEQLHAPAYLLTYTVETDDGASYTDVVPLLKDVAALDQVPPYIMYAGTSSADDAIVVCTNYVEAPIGEPSVFNATTLTISANGEKIDAIPVAESVQAYVFQAVDTMNGTRLSAVLTHGLENTPADYIVPKLLSKPVSTAAFTVDCAQIACVSTEVMEHTVTLTTTSIIGIVAILIILMLGAYVLTDHRHKEMVVTETDTTGMNQN